MRGFPTPSASEQVSLGGGREPRWGPRGGELFYRNDAGMVAVAVGTDPVFRVGRRKVLFDDDPYVASGGEAMYDVHPDGRHFLMTRRGSEGRAVVVVLNWFAQLRAEGGPGGRAGRRGNR